MFPAPLPDMPDDDMPEGGAVTEMDDGGLLIDLDPQAEPVDMTDHANLAELMTPEDRGRLAAEILDAIQRDKESRQEWLDKLKDCLKIAGLEPDTSPGPFDGASRAVDPLVLEAALQFHARAMGELCPPGGPVRTQVLGEQSDDKLAQGERVRDYLNYWATEQAPEWGDDTDKLLFYLPYYGSLFKKSWFDAKLGRVTSRLVWPESLIVNYDAVNLDEAERITHKPAGMSKSYVKRMQAMGLWLDDDLGEPSRSEPEGVRETADRMEGRSSSQDDDEAPYEIYECHTSVDLSTWIDGAPEEPVECIVVVAAGSTQRVLAVHRNVDERTGQRRHWFTHWYAFPGPGFYGLSLIDVMRSTQTPATGALRALFDSAAFANMQGGFVSNAFKADKNSYRLSPGLWQQTNMPAEVLANSFYTPPFKEPSMVLENLRQSVREAGKRIGAISDAAIGEIGRADVPVGTMMAALEQSSRPVSAMHTRLHRAARREFAIVSRLMGEHLPDEYPYSVAGDDKVIARTDFDDRVDIVPVSDPSAPTQMHRVMMAQMRLQVLSSAPPGMADVRQAYRDVMVALDPDGADRLIPERDDAPSLDPVSENIRLMAGRPVRATITQDHDSHMAAHGAILQLVGSMPALAPMAPVIQQQITAHMAEHMAHKYAVMVAAQIGVDPTIFVTEDEDDEAPAIPPQLEGMIAKPAAEATQAFVQQAIQAMDGGGQQGADPMMLMAQADMTKAEAAKMSAEARIKVAELSELDSQRDFAIAQAKLRADTGVKLENIRSGERKTAATIEAKNIN